MSERCSQCESTMDVRRVPVVYENEDGSVDQQAPMLRPICADCRGEFML